MNSDKDKNQEQAKKFYKIHGEKLFLVPYLKDFVQVYNQWMQDQEILYLTGSEPLTLQEEYDNQESWLKDKQKYTFIIFEKSKEPQEYKEDFPEYARSGIQAGDINLFFHDYIEPNEAEIDVMIGEKSCRKKGLAKEATLLMMDFGRAYYKKDTFIAKIKKQNSDSIKLFESLGYQKFDEIQAFDEIHYKIKFEKQMSIEQFKQNHKIEEIQGL